MPPRKRPVQAAEAAVETSEEMPKRGRPTRKAAEKGAAEVEAPKAKEVKTAEENGAGGDAPKRRGRAAKASVEEKEPAVGKAAPRAKRTAKAKAAPKEAPKKAPAKASRRKPKAKEDDNEPEEEDQNEESPPKKAKTNEPEDEEPEDDKKATSEKPASEKPTSNRRAKKAEPQGAEEDEMPAKRNAKKLEIIQEDNDEKAPARKTKKQPSKDAKSADKVNNTETSHESIDYSCNRKNANGHLPNFKISSWNVSGIRSWLKKDGAKYITAEDPDIFCLQETKCSEDKLPEEVNVPGYKTYWCGSDKEGYAGVGVYTKTEPLEVKYGIGVKEYDDEGRCITAEYENFYLINVYVPNAGRGLVTLPKRLSWNDVFKAYVKELDSKKPVIVCGDMNVAHNEIDIANPKANKKNAGFTQEERDGMTDFLGDGYVDTFRELYPAKTDVYTFWSYMQKSRAKNIGWRLDYFIVSKRFMDNVCDNVVRSEVFGSDHCPVVLFVHL